MLLAAQLLKALSLDHHFFPRTPNSASDPSTLTNMWSPTPLFKPVFSLLPGLLIATTSVHGADVSTFSSSTLSYDFNLRSLAGYRMLLNSRGEAVATMDERSSTKFRLASGNLIALNDSNELSTSTLPNDDIQFLNRLRPLLFIPMSIPPGEGIFRVTDNKLSVRSSGSSGQRKLKNQLFFERRKFYQRKTEADVIPKVWSSKSRSLGWELKYISSQTEIPVCISSFRLYS